MNLFEVAEGEKVMIADLNELDHKTRRRLNDLGVREGEQVCYKCKMPFGGPCMLNVAGQSLGIRRKEAACIGVIKT